MSSQHDWGYFDCRCQNIIFKFTKAINQLAVSNTISKRLSLLRSTKDQAQEQGWSLRCLCGTDLAGLREDESQKVACPNCERLHFILPINTYPNPKRAKKKRKEKEGEPFQKVAWRIIRNAGRLIRQGIRNFFVKIARSIIASLVSILVGIRNWFTPLRIAISLLIIILSFGGFFGYRQQIHSKALQTLREAIAQGDQAIEQEQWVEATEQFHLAAGAINQLGRNDQFAWKILQKDRELQAIDGLCVLSLDDIIQSASGKGKTTLNWQTEFKTMIQNRWMVMESWVLLDASEKDSDAILAYPMTMNGEKVNFIWPANLFRPIKQKENLHVLCAGQIESIERTEDPRFDWVVKVHPETAFLWCFEETISPLGFELDSEWLPEDSLRVLLKQQRRLFTDDEGENQ